MKIALAVEGTRGDIHPMLALGTACARAGHDVVVCAPPDFEEDTLSRGLAFHAVGQSVVDFMTEVAAAVAGSNFATLRECDRYLVDSIKCQFEAMPDATSGCDRILGAGTQFAAATAAELHGVPYRFVAYCPSLIPSREYPPVALPVESLPPWLNRIAWAPVKWLVGRVLRKRIDPLRAHLGLPPVADLFPYLLSSRPLLAVDAELAPAPSDTGMRIDTIPCLHPTSHEPLPAKLEAFLDAGPPPVYIGFGSMTDPTPRETTETLIQATEIAGCRALISRGWAGLADGALPESVHPVGSVSHPALFSRVAGVVHHGGAGTTHNAARAGVPQFVVPHLLDQFYWAGRVRMLGLGPPALSRQKLDAALLGNGIRELVENEILAERAGELGARLRLHAAEPLDIESILSPS